MERLPSGRVTFLFTDIEGSTRLFGRLGDGYVEVLDRHNTILRDVWSRHGGAEVKTEGDSFLVAFSSGQDALAAAVDGQQRIAAAEWGDAGRLLVRMGLHAGLAAPRDGDYVAMAVHQAARVVAAANGGQILLTDDTLRDVAADGAGLVSLGKYRLRDFDQPVELFAARFGGDGETSPPRAVPAEGHNLTRPTTRLIGRTRDLEAITQSIAPDALVTIVGPGGVGKTRLITEIGRMLAPRWTDGVWFVDLSALPPGAPVAGVVADALSVASPGRDPTEAVIDGLATRSALVLLDNCEHVADGVAAFYEAVRRALPRVAWVATSQETLRVPGEHVWRLGPLDPDREAIDLFLDRASRASPGFVPDDAQRNVIAQICARLDGIPLAIELAAARLDVMTPQTVLAGLDDRFRMLRHRQRGRPDRQQSLNAMLDWSYDLLPPDHRVVLRRLSVFADAFTLDAAVVAAGAADLDAASVVDGVWSLVDKSLLVTDLTAGATRFRQFETVRAYTTPLLGDAEHRGSLERIAAWYLDRFGLWHGMGTDVVGDLAGEANNIRNVIHALGDEDAETAQLLAVSLAYLHVILGTYVEGVEEIARYAGELTTPTTSRAVLLSSLSRMRSRIGEKGDEAALDEAEALLDSVGPEPDWAAGTVGVARALWLESVGRRSDAIGKARREAAAADGDDARARWYSALGLLLAADGDTSGAIAALRLGLAAEERLGNPVETAIAYNNLAEHELQAGDVADAAIHQLETLTLAAEIGSRVLTAFSMIVASRIAGDSLGRWEDAASLQATADATLNSLGVSLGSDDVAASAAVQERARSHLGSRYASIWSAGEEAALEDAIDAARRILVEASAR